MARGLPFFVCGEVTSDLTSFASDTAAAPTLGFMRDGKWRKARDAAKDLCKKDRPRYMPLLVEANAGLARELIGKGLAKDAAPATAKVMPDAVRAVATPAVS